MKKLFRSILLLMLGAALVLTLGACSSLSKEDIKEYGELIGEVIEIVSEAGESDSPADNKSNNPSQSDLPQNPPAENNTPAEDPEPAPEEDAPAIDKDGKYTSKEDVALYIHTYGCLPSNFVTKNEARSKGWNGGSLEKYFPGCSIGGDKFGNNEGLLPKAKGRQYYECDIDTMGQSSRGAKRIVYSNDGLIYYTDDHYESFTLLYGEE